MPKDTFNVQGNLHIHRRDSRLDEVLTLLRQIQAQGVLMAGELDTLTTDVEANGTAVGSAITLLQGLKAALDAAGTDPAALAALSASLETNTQALADAVVANTPAA